MASLGRKDHEFLMEQRFLTRVHASIEVNGLAFPARKGYRWSVLTETKRWSNSLGATGYGRSTYCIWSFHFSALSVFTVVLWPGQSIISDEKSVDIVP